MATKTSTVTVKNEGRAPRILEIRTAATDDAKASTRTFEFPAGKAVDVSGDDWRALMGQPGVKALIGARDGLVVT